MGAYKLYFETYSISETSEKHKAETLAGRCALARGLQECFSLPFSEDMLSKAEHGKLFLSDHTDIHFNISHSNGLAVAAVAPFPIGVDVEYPREHYSDALIRRVCAHFEAAALFSSENPAHDFAVLWTKKESYLKLTGEGITVDLRKLCIPDSVTQETTVLPSGHIITVSFFNH